MAVKPNEKDLESALIELRELGFDSELENIRCLVRVEEPAQKYGHWLRDLESQRKRRPQRPADWLAVEGKLLVNAGRLAQGRALLQTAVESSSRLPARSWLGECLILEGRFDDGLQVLKGASEPWSAFFRSAARLALGDLAGSRADCDSFLRGRPGAAGLGLRAVIAAQEKRWKEAHADLEGASKASPGQAWPMALAAAIYQAAADLPGQKKALSRGLAIRPSAWLYAESAKVSEKLGIIPEAIESAAQAVRLEPSADHHALKAHLHVCWREYDKAVEEYILALSFGTEASLLFMRSKANACAGHMTKALEDAQAALRAEPGDANLAAWKIQMLIAGRDKGRAEIEISALERASKPLAHFCRGYRSLFDRDFAGAFRSLNRCIESGKGEAVARKAEFYRTVASILQEPAPKAGKSEKLFLIGMGVNPPYSATADALRALSRCQVIFNNVMDEENFEILRPFCGDCRPVAYHQNGDEGRLSDEMMAEVRRGRTVGFVTRGNALVYGPLGTELRRRCIAAGHSSRCFPAVCSFDMFSARCDLGSDGKSMTVVDSSALGDGAAVDTTAALIIYLDMKMPEDRYREMCAHLRSVYGKTRECLVFDHVVDQAPLRRSVAQLPALWPSLSFSAIFHIPGINPS